MTSNQKRKEIKRILSLLEEKNRLMFKRMYSYPDLDKDINDVVDQMDSKKLSWALKQCQASYHEIFRILKS